MDNNDQTISLTKGKVVNGRSIFKKQVPLDQFYTLIHNICPSPTIKLVKSELVNDTDFATDIGGAEYACFTLDVNAFKRGIFLGAVEPFMQMLATEYYSKRCAFYAERNMKTPAAFANFEQVIKHVCKNNNILITSALKYEQSQSNKVYYIHFKIKTNSD
jgi:hypothetical protein